MLKKIDELKAENGLNFYIDEEKLLALKTELEDFLKDETDMNTLDFSKRMMNSLEIKTNNTIEGYFDDVSVIENVIRNRKTVTCEDKKNRILNLHKGYKYILEKKSINKESLKVLYDILSKDLLEAYDLSHMGDYYREGEVFIYFSDNILVEPDKGVDYSLIEELMDNLIGYLDKADALDTMTDHYIKSQIAHFYFIYLHPYFDINGRTARTTAMWYLLNNEAYPYIIFNRAIESSKNVYCREIRKVKSSYNLTDFINYLMVNTKTELEKEYIIQVIKSSTSEKLDSVDFTTILNILSMNGLKTLKDFTYLYNLKNDKKRVKEVYSDMILPLLDKGILTKVRDTNSMYGSLENNFVFDFNRKILDIDKSKVRRLSLDLE